MMAAAVLAAHKKIIYKAPTSLYVHLYSNLASSNDGVIKEG